MIAVTWLGTTRIANNNNKKLKYYPSPVKDNLTIESGETIKTVGLLDYQGRILYRFAVNAEIYKLDMSSYSPGIYLIEVLTSEGSSLHKIIKQ